MFSQIIFCFCVWKNRGMEVICSILEIRWDTDRYIQMMRVFWLKGVNWVLWKSFSYAVIQSGPEAGEWTSAEDNLVKGRCTHLYIYSVDKCQEKSVLSTCDAWSSCLVRYKLGCRHPGHLAEMNTTAQVLQVQHVHKCFTKSRPNYLECCLYH